MLFRKSKYNVLKFKTLGLSAFTLVRTVIRIINRIRLEITNNQQVFIRDL